MLRGTRVGDKVVAFPYGVGTVKNTEDGSYFSIEVEFENVNGVMHRHTFSSEGEIISWQHVVSCWTIKNAPSWVWEHFEKPKVTEPFEKWVLVNITGVIQRQFDTSEDMEIYVDRHSTAYRKAKITGEIEYEVEE